MLYMKKFASARKGIWTAAVWAAAIALVVLVNLVVRAVPARYTQLDLSEAGLYSLSQETLQVVRDIQQDVTIYYLCETGSEDTLIQSYLDRCAAENRHIRWQLKDPAIYPTFAAQYGAETSSSGSLILVSGEDSLVLDAAELYEYDYTDYASTGSYSLRFDGENDLTAALYRLTSGEQRRAYALTGHGEQPLTETLTITLEKQGFALGTLSLLSGEVPEDCDLLILNVPQDDLSGAGQKVNELGRLRTYLDQGGKLLVLTGGYYETPRLDELLAEFGLSRVEGIVAEGQGDHALYGYPCSLLPDYASPLESTALDGLDTTRPVLLELAQGIQLDPMEDVVSEALLMTSDKAYSKAAGYQMTTTDREEGDAEGPFALAAYARREDTGAEVIWIGCGGMDNEMLYQTAPGNVSFLQGCASSLAGQTSGVLIPSKALEAAALSIDGAVTAGLGILFVLVLPAAVLVLGSAVVLLRRRR